MRIQESVGPSSPLEQGPLKPIGLMLVMNPRTDARRLDFLCPHAGVHMKHTIEQTAEGLRITAAAPPEKQRALLDEFAKCAAGTCSCPTPQYEKLQSIEFSAQDAGVAVDLKVKPGEVIDAADIERCLDHTARQVGA
jgi:hypothetical protein